MSRSRRASYAYASMLGFTAVTTLTGLLVTPILVDKLGLPTFGVTRVLVEYAGYLALLDLGLGAALSPLMARALAGDDARSLRAVTASGLRLYRRVTLVTLAIGLSATPWITRVVHGPGVAASDVRTAWVFTVLAFLPLTLAPFRALVDAEQRSYVNNVLLCVQSVLIAAASLIFAHLGLKATGQSLAVAAVSPLSAIALAALAIRRHPGLLRGLREPADPEARAALRRLSTPSLVVGLSVRAGLISDNIILGMLRGPGPVAVLFVTQRLTFLASQQLQGVGTSSWAGLADIHGRGERDLFNRRLVELTRVVAVLGVAALAPIVAFNSQFLNLWLKAPPGGGGVPDGGVLVVAVAAFNAILVAVCGLWGLAFTGTGRVRLLVGPSVASAVVNVAASSACTWRWGMVGPLLGTTAAFLAIQSWALPQMLARHYGTSRRALAWAVVAPLAVGAPYAGLLWWVARGVGRPGWLGWMAEMAASGSAFLLFGAFALIDASDRATWRARIAALVPRRRVKAAA